MCCRRCAYGYQAKRDGERDPNPRTYPKGIKISDAEMHSLNITGDAFHPEWNYTIAPRQPP